MPSRQLFGSSSDEENDQPNLGTADSSPLNNQEDNIGDKENDDVVDKENDHGLEEPAPEQDGTGDAQQPAAAEADEGTNTGADTAGAGDEMADGDPQGAANDPSASGDNQPEDAPPLPPQKESKSAEALDAIYNPERWENDRSLWKFWQNELKKFPTVDELARERELKGLKVDMELVHYEWFDNLICLYRRYLQCAFGDALELPVIGRRLQKYQQTNRNINSWRNVWIRRYKEEQELEARKRQTASDKPDEMTAEARREAAIARRKAKLAEKSRPPQSDSSTAIEHEETTVSASVDQDENMEFEEVNPIAACSGGRATDTPIMTPATTEAELRRMQALARREEKRKAMQS